MLTNETLRFAIWQESGAALKSWFGVGEKAIWNWRTMFGITRTSDGETSRLVHNPTQLGADAMREHDYTDVEREQRRQNAVRHEIGCNIVNTRRHSQHQPWKTAHLRLLGTLPDADVAKRLGRTESAVWVKRSSLGIKPADEQRHPRHRPWNPAYLDMLGTMPDAEVARLLGRKVSAIRVKRSDLGIKSAEDRCLRSTKSKPNGSNP